MTRTEHAQALRARTDVHINCCQAVAVPFAAQAGISEAQATAMAAHFGGGMRMGSVCGAMTGGLMALGLMGKGETETAEFRRRFRSEARFVDCAELLREAQNNGEEKKPHCDRMVYLAVRLVEEVCGEEKI